MYILIFRYDCSITGIRIVIEDCDTGKFKEKYYYNLDNSDDVLAAVEPCFLDCLEEFKTLYSNTDKHTPKKVKIQGYYFEI